MAIRVADSVLTAVHPDEGQAVERRVHHVPVQFERQKRVVWLEVCAAKNAWNKYQRCKPRNRNPFLLSLHSRFNPFSASTHDLTPFKPPLTI
eukprot:3074825-Rhodomonas_salina.2